ncbi:hypothetical protein ACQ4PT_063490 [Festuca glaucescens]
MYLLNPPDYGYPDDGEERPPYVLIEPYAYFADRDNATTATCEMAGFRGTFKLTFCTARPPLVSYMCFEATAYDHTVFAAEPQVHAMETDGGLVLLRVVFGEHPSSIMFPRNREYLVYDATGHSLEHLPHPGTQLRFSDDSVAFVRPHGCSSSYETELVLKPSPYPAPYHSTCKAITIGGDKGTVAWVDLWHNIVLCDVLAKRPELRLLKLPPPILLENQARRGDPRSLRNIALLDGSFKYVEMQFHLVQPGPPALGHWEWEATVWSTKANSSSAKDWIAEYKLKSSEIPEPSPPMLQVGPGEAQPTLSTLQLGLPNLSLQHAGIL